MSDVCDDFHEQFEHWVIENWGQRAHPTEKYGDIGKFSEVIFIILSISNLWGDGPLQPK